MKFDYGYLLDYFTEEKIKARYENLHDMMSVYIKKVGLTTKVRIDKWLLYHAVVDYFTDIHRLKDFHYIKHINEDKIRAYTIYWLLVRKPIQIIDKSDEDLAFVNEEFLTLYLQQYLFDDNYATLISCEERDVHDSFFRTFLYSLKYRCLNQQNIELLILSYKAGRDFQYAVDVSNNSVR